MYKHSFLLWFCMTIVSLYSTCRFAYKPPVRDSDRHDGLARCTRSVIFGIWATITVLNECRGIPSSRDEAYIWYTIVMFDMLRLHDIIHTTQTYTRESEMGHQETPVSALVRSIEWIGRIMLTACTIGIGGFQSYGLSWLCRGLPVIGCTVAQVLFYWRFSRSSKRMTKLSSTGDTTRSRMYIRINNTLYDMTNFIDRHPGGNVIAKYEVTHVPDATGAFNNFHVGSIRARRILHSLRKPDGHAPHLTDTHRFDERSDEISEQFEILRASWERRGLYAGCTIEFILWGICTICIVCTGYWLLSESRPVMGGVVVGVGWAHCGFVQHHAGHLAFTGRPEIDYTIQAIFEGLLKGGSAGWWRRRHNIHHAMPNSVKHDVDLRTTPFFAWDHVLIQKVPTVLLRYQHLLFFPMLVLYVPILATSVAKHVVTKRCWNEMGLIACHFAVSFSVASSATGCVTNPLTCTLCCMFLFYMVGYAVQGVYLGVMFGINHYVMPRVECGDNMSWAEWQLRTTCNWGGDSKIAQYASGFLNLQIEHHLASRMPAENYATIRPEVYQFARLHSIPYTESTFAHALVCMLRGLYEIGHYEYQRRMRPEKECKLHTM